MGCNFAMQFTLTSHQGRLHLSNCNITEKTELKKRRWNINLPPLLLSESNARKSQLEGLEDPSCYSSLETNHLRHRNIPNHGPGLLHVHARVMGLFPRAGPCGGPPHCPSFSCPQHLFCSAVGCPGQRAPSGAADLPGATARAGDSAGQLRNQLFFLFAATG